MARADRDEDGARLRHARRWIQPAQASLRSVKRIRCRRRPSSLSRPRRQRRASRVDIAGRPGGQHLREASRRSRRVRRASGRAAQPALPRACCRRCGAGTPSPRARRSGSLRPGRPGSGSSRARSRRSRPSSLRGQRRQGHATTNQGSNRSKRASRARRSRGQRPVQRRILRRRQPRGDGAALRVDRIAHDQSPRARPGSSGSGASSTSSSRGVERGPHLVVEPGPAVEQVEGAEQIDGRVGVAHHPERRIGVPVRTRKRRPRRRRDRGLDPDILLGPVAGRLRAGRRGQNARTAASSNFFMTFETP